MDELERQEQLLREAMRELQESSTVTADTFFRLNKETSKLGKSIENAEEAIDRFWRGPVGKTTKAFGDVAKGALDAGLAARKNRESFESLNPAIEGAAAALSAIPIVGDVLGKTLSGVGTFVTAELQRSVEAFQTLGSVGGVGAAGLTGLKDSAREAGLAFDQLAKITANNATGLAFATGSTAEGARAVAELTRAARPFQNQLLALGIGISEQTEQFADYLVLNQRLNRSQTRDYRTLASGAADYAKQLNTLSRLTGLSADAVKAELDQQMSNVQFRATLRMLDKELRPQAINIVTAIGAIDKNIGIGIQDMFGGSVGTKAAQDAYRATGGAALEIINQFKAGALSQEEATARIVEAAGRQAEAIGDRFQSVAGNMPTAFQDVLLGMNNLRDSTNLSAENIRKVGIEAALAAQAQDPQTKGMINAQQSLQGFATQMDAFVDSQVMPNATKVIDKLIKGLDKVAGGVNSLANLKIDGERADGGPVKAGGKYLVGEEGPELFSSKQAGFITDTDKTMEYVASRQEYAKKMIKELFSDAHRLQDGFETTLGESVSLAQGGKGGVKIAGAEGTTHYDTQGNFIKHVMPAFTEGLTNVLHAGGEQTASYQAGGANITKNFDPTGELVSRNLDYVAAGMKMLTQTDYGPAGPKTSYKTSFSAGSPTDIGVASGFLPDSAHKDNGGLDGKVMQELMQQMVDKMASIEANTKNGADSSKKLLRASAG